MRRGAHQGITESELGSKADQSRRLGRDPVTPWSPG
jgi:hypothetical protein